jgi:hypothetical protein
MRHVTFKLSIGLASPGAKCELIPLRTVSEDSLWNSENFERLVEWLHRHGCEYCVYDVNKVHISGNRNIAL